ncbi:hypothetical protein EMIT051CA3_110092 [Pseudomonas chlororaphis]
MANSSLPVHALALGGQLEQMARCWPEAFRIGEVLMSMPVRVILERAVLRPRLAPLNPHGESILAITLPVGPTTNG